MGQPLPTISDRSTEPGFSIGSVISQRLGIRTHGSLGRQVSTVYLETLLRRHSGESPVERRTRRSYCTNEYVRITFWTLSDSEDREHLIWMTSSRMGISRTFSSGESASSTISQDIIRSIFGKSRRLDCSELFPAWVANGAFLKRFSDFRIWPATLMTSIFAFHCSEVCDFTLQFTSICNFYKYAASITRVAEEFFPGRLARLIADACLWSNYEFIW